LKSPRRRARALLAALVVSALVAGAPRRAAALSDTWRNVIIGTGAALTLGAVVGLIVYLVQEPYEPPKPATAAPKTASAARLPSFQTVGLGPLPVAATPGSSLVAAGPSSARPAPLPSLFRF
jgi:hypothetical protein